MHTDTASPTSFRAEILLGGKTATGIPVPTEVIERLGAGKRPAVRVTIGTYTYRSTVGVMGGRYMLPLSAANRSAAGVAAGETVRVDLELDAAPREVTVPADLSAALERDPSAGSAFAGLTASQQKWVVVAIEEAKTAETRQRRIDKAVTALREGRAGR